MFPPFRPFNIIDILHENFLGYLPMAKGPGVPTTFRFIALLTNIKQYTESNHRLQGLLAMILTFFQHFFLVLNLMKKSVYLIIIKQPLRCWYIYFPRVFSVSLNEKNRATISIVALLKNLIIFE